MAFSSTTLAVILVVGQIEADIRTPGSLHDCDQGYYDNTTEMFVPKFPESLDLKTYFASFATIMFAFGGAIMFPTIQVDMKKPEDFESAILLAMAGARSSIIYIGTDK